ncbi:proton-conducting membrane transporter [Salinirarus marinus]|uniref:NADH-quinone oxidoreductase subunit J family protein n=1 Tax=Salinirarus marinus TaxID=3068310 RepID=UPI003C6CB8B4
MTTKPELKLGSHLVPGLAAVALFVVMAAAFLGAPFGEPAGFPADANITASIGYALFNIDLGAVGAEGFLVPFEIIDLVLVAALAGAVMLARREEEGSVVTLLADGGREVRRAMSATEDEEGEQ